MSSRKNSIQQTRLAFYSVILSAFGLSFLITFDEVLLAIFLTTPSLQTLPVRSYQAVTYELTPAVAVVSVLLMALLCAAMIIRGLYNWAMKRMVPGLPQPLLSYRDH